MNISTALAALLALGLLAGAGHAEQQKTIKDPAEYNAYMSALNTADPVKKAAAMEDFVRRYPNSVVALDALEQAMAAYQSAGNAAQVEATAKRIMQRDANNVRVLAIVTYLERGRATQGNAQALADMRGHAALGMRLLPAWQKPEGLAEADHKKLVAKMSVIFHGAAGFAALQDKDYAKARNLYLVAVNIDPANLSDVYQLGIAELQMSPLDPTGFWYVARARQLAQAGHNAAAAQSIGSYGKAKYKFYHGSEDGWDRIAAQVASQSAPPAGFAKTVTPKP